METSGITPRPSKPWGCRSKTLTPTPEPAGYCAGDVAGERGDRASELIEAVNDARHRRLPRRVATAGHRMARRRIAAIRRRPTRVPRRSGDSATTGSMQLGSSGSRSQSWSRGLSTPDQVVVMRSSMRGRASGSGLGGRHRRAPTSTTFADGKIVRIRMLLRPQRSPRSRGAVGARRSRRLLSLRDTARAMSQENVEVVRAIYADWERGDFSATEWLHPEIEFVMVGGPSRWHLDGACRDGRGHARVPECLGGLSS